MGYLDLGGLILQHLFIINPGLDLLEFMACGDLWLLCDKKIPMENPRVIQIPINMSLDLIK